MIKLRLPPLLLGVLCLACLSSAQVQASDHLARLHASLSSLAGGDGQRERPRKLVPMFSFESEKDGLAFINEVKRPGIRTAALNAWPDKVWRTEIHVDFNPSEAAIKALELELQNLLLKHKGTYLGMVLQMRD